MIIVVAAISGTARSVCGTSYNTLNYVDVPEAQMPHANSLAATSQQLSLGLGVAAATVALRLGDLTAHLFPGHPANRTAYTVAFGVMAIPPLIAALGVTRLHIDSGSAARRPSRVTAQRCGRPIARPEP